MSYSIPGQPSWTFDTVEIERQVASFAQANGITTQAAWVTFVGGISTLAQAIAVCKGLLLSTKCSVP